MKPNTENILPAIIATLRDDGGMNYENLIRRVVKITGNDREIVSGVLAQNSAQRGQNKHRMPIVWTRGPVMGRLFFRLAQRMKKEVRPCSQQN